MHHFFRLFSAVFLCASAFEKLNCSYFKLLHQPHLGIYWLVYFIFIFWNDVCWFWHCMRCTVFKERVTEVDRDKGSENIWDCLIFRWATNIVNSIVLKLYNKLSIFFFPVRKVATWIYLSHSILVVCMLFDLFLEFYSILVIFFFLSTNDFMYFSSSIFQPKSQMVRIQNENLLHRCYCYSIECCCV